MRLALILLATVLVVLPGRVSAQQKRFALKQGAISTCLCYAPAYVAEGLGYYAEEGIDLETVQIPSATAVMAALTTRDVQYSLSTGSLAVTAVSKGSSARAFAAIMTQYPGNIVLSKDTVARLKITDEMPIPRRLDSLRGLRLAAHQPNTAPDLLLRYILRSRKLDPETDVTILPITDAGILAALDSKLIDGFSYSSPLAEEAVLRHGAMNILSLASGRFEPLAGILSVVMLADKSWIDKEPGAAAAVTRALWRAMITLQKDPEKAKAATRKAMPNIDARAFAAAFDNYRAAFPTTPQITPAMIVKVMQFNAATGIPATAVSPDTVFDNRPYEAAAKSMRR